jgi:uncharacterized protein YjbI with pentapeptide repeats
MKIKIKHRVDGRTLFAHEQEENSVKITLAAAVRAGADLSYADLSHTDLSYIDLSNIDLSHVDLRHAGLSYADLSYTDLSYADLSYAKLVHAILVSADLSSAKLNFANLSFANLGLSYLTFADLGGADLGGARLDSTDLRFADLETTTYGKGVIIGNSPTFINGLTWPVYIFRTHIKIGCRIHTKQEWLNFNDADIAKMESRASEFWARWKKHILWMAFEGSK